VKHMSRLGAVVVALGALSLACGGSDPESAAPLDPAATAPDDVMDEPTEPVGVPSDPEWGLDFSITGRSVPMTARAEVKVVEGRNAVHVAITGRTSGTDLMMIDLTFDGIENALGPHEVQFSLPEGGEHIANGSLDGTWYYSQGGTIELSVSPEGSIEGSFEIALARGEMTPGLPIVFAPDEEATPLVGRFRGQWVLNCLSRLAGHQSLIPGGDYCDNLEF
jgi:hypothetical protein